MKSLMKIATYQKLDRNEMIAIKAGNEANYRETCDMSGPATNVSGNDDRSNYCLSAVG